MYIDHPLDWWALGGYPMVMRELRCSNAVARRRVHAMIRAYFRRTGDARWRPIGNRGYAELREAIRRGGGADDELV